MISKRHERYIFHGKLKSFKNPSEWYIRGTQIKKLAYGVECVHEMIFHNVDSFQMIKFDFVLL